MGRADDMTREEQLECVLRSLVKCDDNGPLADCDNGWGGESDPAQSEALEAALRAARSLLGLSAGELRDPRKYSSEEIDEWNRRAIEAITAQINGPNGGKPLV